MLISKRPGAYFQRLITETVPILQNQQPLFEFSPQIDLLGECQRMAFRNIRALLLVVLNRKEKRLNKLVGKIVLIGTVLLVMCSVLIHPFGRVKSERSDASLMPGASLDPQIGELLERSCKNCHSEKTEWPWYSYVAPMSWMIESDVSRGRSHINLTRWSEYSLDERGKLLSQISVMVRNRAMPLPKYLILHPEARISDAEIAQLNEWARAERRRMKLLATQEENVPSGGSQ